MAIKISGNTVIDDSRNITSSGTMSANAYIGDGSQLTNLPGGGNVLEATASGTLADGSKVIVNADGTVSVVAQTETTGGGTGLKTVFDTSAAYMSSAYDSANNRVVLAYQDASNSDKGTAVVGTVSGTNISFGTPVVFHDSSTYHVSIAFDSTNNKVVISYMNAANWYGYAIVGTVSGTSISFGSPSSSFGTTSSIDNTSMTYDSANSRVVITYRDAGNSSYGTAIVGTVSGNSISLGTPVVFNSGDTRYTSATFDSTNNKVVIGYQDAGNSSYGTAVVGTVSGTSISFGSEVVFESASVSWPSATFDSTNNKVIIAYNSGGSSGRAVVGTVSGTSISFGSPVVFNAANSDRIATTYNSANQKVVIVYRDIGNSNYVTAIAGTVSGTSISFGSEVVVNTAVSYNNSVVYDSTNQKVVIGFRDGGNSNYATAAVFIESGLSIPQLGTASVFETATTYFTSTAYDSANQKVVVVYRDDGNSQYGTAVVGTVSGTSISFGTPVVFNSAITWYPKITFDSTNNKVVIVYMDNGNSNYGTAVVGTVSGTSISFGTPAVFESGSTSYNSPIFDPSNGKVVIAYKGTSNYGKAVVGTVSGTSISFGSPVIFNSANTTVYDSATYDSTNQKVVIAYRDDGNSYYGKAVVGTVSGTSISFGSITEFASSTTTEISVVYDSTNQKVVIAFRDDGMTGQYHGKAIVGTVSGTGISFGSITTFEYGAVYDTAALYDSANQKVVIAYRDVDNSHYGTVVAGTISGTSISFGIPFVFEYARAQYVSSAYDSTNKKAVFSYADQGNSSYGTSVVFSPVTKSTNLTSENFIGISDGAYTNGQSATIQLAGSVDDAQSGLTPGSKYYVQNNGTLSTSADSPSVFAGTAVATTKLIVKN